MWLLSAFPEPSLLTCTLTLSAVLMGSGDYMSMHSKHHTCKPRPWKVKERRKLFVCRVIWAM